MSALEKAVSTAGGIFKFLGDLKDLFSSFKPAFIRFGTPTLDLDKFSEDFFAGQVLPGGVIKTRGVLFSYACCVPTLIYVPSVMRNPRKSPPGPIQKEPLTGRLYSEMKLEWNWQTMSVPVSRLNDVTLEENSTARIMWLYPDTFSGLILDHNPLAPNRDTSQAKLTLGEVFKLREDQRPIPCLVPTTGKYDTLAGNIVEIIAEVRAADSKLVDTIVQLPLDPLRIDFLSRCIRPFEANYQCVALDVRGDKSSIKPLAIATDLRMVIGVQGLIAFDKSPSEDQVKTAFKVAGDAVPDRSGDVAPGINAVVDVRYGLSTGSILSDGSIAWFIDNETFGVGAYVEVNLSDRESTMRSITELAHHWQAWQKQARRAIERAIGCSPKIRPLLVWDPEKLKLFYQDGLQLPPPIEAQLYSYDPAVRKGIDWLRVGLGRFGK